MIIGALLTIWVSMSYTAEKEAQILKGTNVVKSYAIKTLYGNLPIERMDKSSAMQAVIMELYFYLQMIMGMFCIYLMTDMKN